MRGILDEANVGGKAGIDAIQAWLTQKEFTGFMIEHEDEDRKKKWSCEFSREQVLSVLRGGIVKGESGLSKNKLKDLDKVVHRKDLTRFFQGGSPGTHLDERFSHITMMRACYDDTCPALTTGTIVQSPDNESVAYVCVQPRCDSVRIDSARSFPFLPFKSVSSSSGEQFDMVLQNEPRSGELHDMSKPEGTKYVRLRSLRKPYHMKLILFEPSPDNGGMIKAIRDSRGYYFEDASEKKKYRWMGELRGEHALRLADEFASVFGRVGVNESEWLRRWAEKR